MLTILRLINIAFRPTKVIVLYLDRNQKKVQNILQYKGKQDKPNNARNLDPSFLQITQIPKPAESMPTYFLALPL